jgi:hypothetical protein
LSFWIKYKNKNKITAVNFWSFKPGFGTGSGSAIRKNAVSGSALINVDAQPW